MIPSNLKRLKYEQARFQIRDGDVLFCQGRGPISWLIRKFTGPISHIGVMYWWGGRLYVLESKESHGTRIVPASGYARGLGAMKKYKGRLVVGRAEGLDAVSALVWAQDRVPVGYDYREIGRIALRRFRISSRRGVVEDSSFICSEFVAGAHEAGGVAHPFSGRGYITPTNIFDSPHIKKEFEIV